MFKAFGSISVAILCGSLGHIFLSKGLHHTIFSFQNPWILAGILLEAAYFPLWMIVLAHADVSWATPMNALEYIVVAILAILFLGEAISVTRWVGIIFILCGAVFMTASFEEKI